MARRRKVGVLGSNARAPGDISKQDERKLIAQAEALMVKMPRLPGESFEEYMVRLSRQQLPGRAHRERIGRTKVGHVHDGVGNGVGAELVLGAAPTPVWMKAVSTREGSDIVTRCCVVAGGEFFPIEVRVNVPELARQLRATGLLGSGDSVSGFGSFLKKAVRAVTKNKVTRAVSKAVSKVVKNPIVQLANPMMAISAHTLGKAATGKGTIKGPLGKVVDMGASAALSAAGPAAKLGNLMPKLPPVGAGALNFVRPQTAAALGVGMRTVSAARSGGVIAAAAKTVQNAARHRPELGKKVQALGPALAKKVVESSKVKASIANIAQKAKAGSVDARLAASVIARSSGALDRISALGQATTGGVAGLLITPDGRIVKAPRGKFLQKQSTSPRPETLYRGPKLPTLKGLFSAVSGSPEWGGHRDPGQEIDGPFYPVRDPGGSWPLDDYAAASAPYAENAVAGWLTP